MPEVMGESLCPTEITAGESYECRVSSSVAGTRYTLSGAPTGMTIQPRSGYLHWTPYDDQTGTFAVTLSRAAGSVTSTDTLTFVVSPSATTPPPGLYVSPEGDDANPGTPAAPFATLQAATHAATAGTTIYLRGGDYYNDGYGSPYASRSTNAVAVIDGSGTAAAPITIRPQGNEYVRLISDANGISFHTAEYWTLESLELQGDTQSLTQETALDLWWTTGPEADEISGRGIAMDRAFHITIRNCVIHDFPGAGLSNNHGEYVSLEDSVVYDNAWWTTSGTHGFANPTPVTTDGGATDDFGVSMLGNVVFGNQSSMISRNGNGYINLEIDEGNGLQMQNTDGAYAQRFLIRDNLCLFNGKAGVGLNTVDRGVIENNSFYQNSQAVDGLSGEIRIQASSSDSIAGNLFHPFSSRDTISTSSGYVGVGSNYTTASGDSTSLPAAVLQVSAVFADPEHGDFAAAPGIPSGFGVDPAVLVRQRARLVEYGLTPSASPTMVDDAYVRAQRMRIFSTWPDPMANPDIPADLILRDPDVGHCYRYVDRADWPGTPASGTLCPR